MQNKAFIIQYLAELRFSLHLLPLALNSLPYTYDSPLITHYFFPHQPIIFPQQTMDSTGYPCYSAGAVGLHS
jgi:hypothetical protein